MPQVTSVFRKLKNFFFGSNRLPAPEPGEEIKQCQNCKVMAMFVRITEKKLLKEPTDSIKPPEASELPRYIGR